MNFNMNDIEYTVNVPCQDPFIVLDGMVYGTTPIFEEKYLDVAIEKYDKVYKNLRLAQKNRFALKFMTKTWEVSSEKSDEIYVVKVTKGKWSCSCKGFTFKRSCKHIKECKKEI